MALSEKRSDGQLKTLHACVKAVVKVSPSAHYSKVRHTSEAEFTDTERTPKNLREVEAEAVALLCCEALNLEGADYCRGYIQNWLCPAVGYNGDAILEKSRYVQDQWPPKSRQLDGTDGGDL